ncbi:MAG: hypothetical protein QJR14_00715 [Bacillota bacterium]|nr:hypothetical protein [Bacillota bacterium]
MADRQPLEAQQVTPGPYPGGVPTPTEVDCILVDKVYDFCSETDSRDATFTIPVTCLPPVPAGTTVTCAAGTPTCTLGTPAPIPTRPGFVNVSVVVTVPLTFTLVNPDGTTRCTFSDSFTAAKTVTLYAPTGTTIDCEVTSAGCGPCTATATQIFCSVSYCLLIESTARVKLLVPTYGFCMPAECVVSPTPPVPCPPPYPPQLPPTTAAAPAVPPAAGSPTP